MLTPRWSEIARLRRYITASARGRPEWLGIGTLARPPRSPRRCAGSCRQLSGGLASCPGPEAIDTHSRGSLANNRDD